MYFFKSVFVWHSGLLVYNVIFTVRPNRPDTLCWRCCHRMTNVFLSCDKNLHCCIIILSFTLNMKFRNWKWPVSASRGYTETPEKGCQQDVHVKWNTQIDWSVAWSTICFTVTFIISFAKFYFLNLHLSCINMIKW